MADPLPLLLQTKASIEPVSPEVLAAAEQLRELGLIRVDRRTFVRCAFTEDRDFPHTSRTCTERIFLSPNLDENNHDYRCPECGREVFPDRYKKRRFEELRVKILDDGVAEYVQSKLGGDASIEQVDDVPFAWRVKRGLAGVHVCIADFCDHQQIMSIQWAQQNPTCYVAVNPRALERFGPVDWLCTVPLADIIRGKVDLRATVEALASATEPKHIPALATPVYSKTAHRPEAVVEPYETSTHLFILELGGKTASINGVEVLAAQAHAAHAILRQLAKAYLEDVLAGAALDDFCCQTPDEITANLQKKGLKKDSVNQEQVRRTINRLQESIEQRLRQAGIATERDSVIQVSPNTTKEGYRLNPLKVAIRPLNAGRDEK
ncbi:MAG: hypothetical protein IT442_18120 [Phycisphaeraceae bacterium]|nr:hypothetical protein [Phycisphaeraceae bacterium]